MAGIKLLRDVGFLVHGGYGESEEEKRKEGAEQGETICARRGGQYRLFTLFNALSLSLSSSMGSNAFAPFRFWDWFTVSVYFFFILSGLV